MIVNTHTITLIDLFIYGV